MKKLSELFHLNEEIRSFYAIATPNIIIQYHKDGSITRIENGDIQIDPDLKFPFQSLISLLRYQNRFPSLIKEILGITPDPEREFIFNNEDVYDLV